MERNLLNILELPDQPRKIVRRSLMMNRSASKFLLNIYQNVLSNNTTTSNNEEYGNMEEFNFSDRYINIIDRSDLIMTFGAHNPHSGNASKMNRGRRIWFDVSEISIREHIIAAELRLYQSLSKGVELRKAYIIAIYIVAQMKYENRKKLYIDSTSTMTDKSGWIILNVTQALEYWVKHPKKNRGLYLAVYRDDYTGRVIRPDDIGIVGVSGVSDKQPFMVGFFKSSDIHRKYGTLSKQKRDIKFQNDYTNSINIKDNPFVNLVMKKQRKNICSIRKLYISFKELQWENWIIAPDGYDAYYCSGECTFPMNTHMNATNHAIVQTLVHLVKPYEVPKPCCVPTKLSPISVVYFLDESNIVLKKYKNMVIDSCGCH
ncbi:protein 60A-like [Ceratina calcarata]|uniref:Protein 60A-like n=1 Tax=Ceratina calcarata TaxID=156304 RepID=A0AAJ7J718_9HYME|nr:protein 60A-like [Ceratina calcarata]